MKNTIFQRNLTYFFLLLIWGCFLPAIKVQSEPTIETVIFACQGKKIKHSETSDTADDEIIKKYILEKDIQDNEKKIQFIELPYRIETIEETPKLPKESEIIIGFINITNNTLLKIGDVDIKNIKIKIGDRYPYIWQQYDDDKKLEFISINLLKLRDEPNLSRCEIIVEIDAGGRKERNFLMYNRWVGYGIADYNRFLWIPFTLICTNFDTGERGLPFAVLPVSLAVGTKWYPFNNRLYFGVSGLIGLVWATDIVAESPDNSEFGEKFLTKLNFGAIVDLFGWFHTGVAYVKDFRENVEDPGLVFIFGPGTRLLEFLNRQ